MLSAEDVNFALEVAEMSRALTPELTAEEAEMKAAVEKLFVEIEREHEQMQRDQEEIERSKTRTRAMLAKLKAA